MASGRTETVTVSGHEIALSNLDKVLFPAASATKQDLVEHARRVAGRQLPHVRGRPLVLRRFPDGIDEGGFFQKEAPDHFPGWIERTTLDKVEGGTVTHVVAEDEATLVYLADQGTVELHALLSRAEAPRHPDQLVLDLDPSTDDLAPVVAAARTIRDLLDDLDVTGFVSSTGSRGQHVRILLDGSATFEEVRPVVRALAERVVAADPDTFTLEQRKDARGDRLFVDTLRNAYGQHAVVPYSLRARPEAPVAVPLTWDEATSSAFDPRATTVGTLARRLAAQRDDPWAGMGRHRYAASALADRLERLARTGEGS